MESPFKGFFISWAKLATRLPKNFNLSASSLSLSNSLIFVTSRRTEITPLILFFSSSNGYVEY
jgi:hypothetical protein